MLLGPIRHSFTAKERAIEQGIGHYVYPRFTRVAKIDLSKGDVQGAYEFVCSSSIRNRQIVEDVRVCISEGRTPVILTRYREHAKRLHDQLSDVADHSFLLYGGNSDSVNSEMIRQMKNVPRDESLILVATGQKIGEGFSFPRLDTLMLAAPISSPGMLEQYVGRLNRDYDGKVDVIVYDYVDSHIRMFDNMYSKRLKTYKQIGFQVITDPIVQKQSTNAIFDSESYVDTFERDLIESEESVIVSSPDMSMEKIKRFVFLMKPRQETGVKVTVITTSPENNLYESTDYYQEMIDILIENGIRVTAMDEVMEHFAVIDNEIVWHGGMNLLGKEDIWDNLMRIESESVASELIEMTLVSIKNEDEH